MDILFGKNNVGREVTINGKTEVISYVTTDRKKFRIESDHTVKHEYDLSNVEQAKTLTVSTNAGASWLDLPVMRGEV
jgi:hypothetical protein